MTLDLRAHFTEFRTAQPGRIHLAAHSHHFWPDAACEAHRRALADAARLADNKWETIFGELIRRAPRRPRSRLRQPDLFQFCRRVRIARRHRWRGARSANAARF